MHILKIAAAVAAAVLLSACVTTYGDDEPIKVEVNDFYPFVLSTWHPHTCAAGALSRIRVTEEPKHGQIIVEKMALPQDNPKLSCYGKDILSRVVLYRPNKNYRGPDSFAIQFSRQVDDRDMRQSWGSRKFILVVE